ncbi:MAG: hypothetical protein WC091_05915 [Sulfuricellaceae bacterium]
MNPVRAGMVMHQGEYRWSSYGANALGDASLLIRPHPVYGGLGLTDKERQAAYRELFRYELDPGQVDEIRQATHGGLVLGSERFAQEIALLAGRRTRRGKAGRPFKKPTKPMQTALPTHVCNA